jgi:hypothetical protein
MKVMGIHWLGVCASNWDVTTAFYRDVLGLSVRSEGVQSSRNDAGAKFMELATANGDFVEVFGEGLPDRDLFRTPMAGFLVDSVSTSRAQMDRKGAVFIGPIRRGGQWEWSYFRSPDGHVHQLLGKIQQRS